ncbi:MAG: hypothetical protein ACI4IX_02845 [Acutalibacteraceae bacterium]
MKKLVSILLAVAMVFSITAVCAFAADCDVPGEINGTIGEVNCAINDVAAEINGDINGAGDKAGVSVAEINAEIDNAVGDISTLISDHAAVANEKLNELGNAIVFESGLNSFLAQIDAFIESIISSIVNFLETELGFDFGE